MQYKPHVKYWFKTNTSPIYKRVSYICFSQLRNEIYEGSYINKINYIVPCKLPLNKLKKYLSFVDGLFTDIPRPYKYRIFKFKKKKYIHVSLESEGMGFYKILLYLTFFRYTQEFPEIINNFLLKFKKDNTPDENFAHFQNTHTDCIAGKFSLNYDNLAGHGLIYYFGKREPINVKTFTSNIKNLNNTKSVQSHFLE